MNTLLALILCTPWAQTNAMHGHTKEKIFSFLDRIIRNSLPAKNVSGFLTSRLCRLFFRKILSNKLLPLELAVTQGKATKTLLAPEVNLSASSLRREAGEIPPPLHLPHTVAPPLYMYTLGNGYCYRDLVLDEDCSFLSGATEDRILSRTLHGKEPDIRALETMKIDGEGIALNISYSDNYYHWFTDMLGPMLLLPKLHNAYICADIRFSYQRETLDMLNIPSSRILPATKHSLYQFKKVHFVPATMQRECIYEALYAYTHSPAFEGMLDRSLDGGERIYISRADVKRRRGITNEKNLLPILSEFGFKRMVFSGRPVLEQIALIRKAKYVVFPQGAACVNMLFCGRDTRFLEFYSPLFFDKVSAGISRSMGLVHHILLGEASSGATRQADYCVNPHELRKALELLCSVKS